MLAWLSPVKAWNLGFMFLRPLGLVLLACSPFLVLAQTKLWVSTAGNDAWNGLASVRDAAGNGPKATLIGARNEIRRLKSLGQLSNAGVVVTVRPGRYRMYTPLDLTASDGGLSNAKVTYQSEVQNGAILDGSKQIYSWKPMANRVKMESVAASVRPYVYQADLRANYIREVGRMRHVAPNFTIQPEWAELFFNENRMNLARWPNAGGAFMTGNGTGNGWPTPTLKAELSTLRTPSYTRHSNFETDTDYWVRGNFNERLFVQFQERVTWINKSSNDLRYAIEDGNTMDRARAAAYYPENLGRFTLVNSLWELDEPGEYYFDRQDLLLYFYPPAAIGSATTRVSMNKSCLINVVGSKYVVIQGFLVEGSRQNGINVVASQSVLVRGNQVRNVGGTGIYVFGGANVTVGSNIVHHTGETGIHIEGGNRSAMTRCNNLAVNNYIHHAGQVQPYYRPGLRIAGYGLTARGNEIAYHRHQAIHYFGNELLIEQNRIHHAVQDALDSAAIYCGDGDWTTRGNVIRYNYLSDIQEGRAGYHIVHGIYMDDMNSSTNVYGNIFRNVEQPIQIGGGHGNSANWNVFVDCNGGVRIDDRGIAAPQSWIDDFFRLAENVPWRSNAWRTKYPEVYETLTNGQHRWPSGNSIVGNISLRNWENDKVGGIYELWGVNKNAPSSILVFDKNIGTLADQFVDEKKGNFTPKPGSQAAANKFPPLIATTMGVKKDAFIDPSTWQN
ncbi:MAG: right-handed parallel beta-helix repeat-containing protein [Chthonomonadaceae bacterium]|nr:right-handed parallel beta-helix repeat-containing protein [Chthonomonadaceae bacterium]